MAFFLHYSCMSELRIECPHCGTTFNVQVDGEPSNMMVFPCARCQTPLMFFHGETLELDRDEFANLRSRLAKVLDVVMKQDGSVSEMADSLKKIVETSNAIAESRASGSEISEDALKQLEKDLADLDVDSFLEKM